MKVLVTFDDGTTKVFNNIDRIDHNYYHTNYLDFTDNNKEYVQSVNMHQIEKVEVLV